MSKMGSERQVTVDPAISPYNWQEVRPGVFQTLNPNTGKPFGQEFSKQPDGRLVPMPQKRSMFQGVMDAYQENIGQPFVRSTPGQMLAGFLGVQSQGTNPEAYQFGQGASMVPGLGAPAGIFKAAAQLPNMIDAGQAGLGLIFGSKALKNGVTAKDAITAEQLMKNGATPNQIFQAGQGLFKGPDGNWRRMTSDIAMEDKFIKRIDEIGGGTILSGDYSLPALYENKALFEAYPQLKDVKVTFDPTLPANKHGSFSPQTKTLTLNPNKPAQTMHETLVHEIQHGIQGMEGWQQGGNAFAMLPENAKMASSKADEALMKIKDRMATVSQETGIPREKISAAARFFAAKKVGANPSREEINAAAELANAPQSVKAIIEDSTHYANIQNKLFEYKDDAYRHYTKLQGEAEAREVERQLQAERARRGLTNPNSRYDNLHFTDLIKKGDMTSNGVEVNWSESKDWLLRQQHTRGKGNVRLTGSEDLSNVDWNNIPVNREFNTGPGRDVGLSIRPFKRSVTLPDGSVIQGYNDPKGTIVYGYDKNGKFTMPVDTLKQMFKNNNEPDLFDSGLENPFLKGIR